MARFFKQSLFNVIICLLTLGGCTKPKESLPEGFVYLKEIDPTIIENARYATQENFLGRIVPGYTSHNIICTKAAALALKAVHVQLNQQGYTLVVYDGYRPQRAVDAFVKWADDMEDSVAKLLYYPNVDKKDLFKLNYIADKSSHTRGSTFDLSIIKKGENLHDIKVSQRTLKDGTSIPYLDDNTVDMGSSFDLFHKASHHDSDLVNEQQLAMRNLLRQAMKKQGFKEYQEEWWHYTLANEPFPDSYFDFVSVADTA